MLTQKHNIQMDQNENTAAPWTLFQKITFRFFFIFLTLYMAPDMVLERHPRRDFIIQYFQMATDWAVNMSNKYFFHVKEVLVPLSGSGDTSYGWAQLWLYLSLAALGSLLWSLLDRRRANDHQLFFWLRTFLRYYLVLILFSYGIAKLFALQMPFPTVSQLATPLAICCRCVFRGFSSGIPRPTRYFQGQWKC